MTLIRKASGEKEPFSKKKLEDSLRRVGADDEAVEQVVEVIGSRLYEGESTRNIYREAFRLLKHRKRSTAARYKLREAIMELGPTGYPFEHFVGQLIGNLGYDVKVGQIIEGWCVRHEVDVVATGKGRQLLVECKFYNSQGKYANVRVPLYIRSRVDDIIKKRESSPEFNGITFQGWIVTNTRFTSDAADYGRCSGLHLIGWDYPRGRGLKDIIEKERFFPVTTLTSINKVQKKLLMDNGIVLCRQICSDSSVADILGLGRAKRRELLDEAGELCGCGECIF